MYTNVNAIEPRVYSEDCVEIEFYGRDEAVTQRWPDLVHKTIFLHNPRHDSVEVCVHQTGSLVHKRRRYRTEDCVEIEFNAGDEAVTQRWPDLTEPYCRIHGGSQNRTWTTLLKPQFDTTRFSAGALLKGWCTNL